MTVEVAEDKEEEEGEETILTLDVGELLVP